MRIVFYIILCVVNTAKQVCSLKEGYIFNVGLIKRERDAITESLSHLFVPSSSAYPTTRERQTSSLLFLAAFLDADNSFTSEIKKTSSVNCRLIAFGR